MNQESHYSAIAERYATNLFYDPESPVVESQLNLVENIFWLDDEVRKTDVLVDCGAGTCVFSSLLAKRRPDCKFICVEPCKEMAEEGRQMCADLPNVIVHVASLEEFLESFTITETTSFLCKEMIHHLSAEARPRAFAQMAGGFRVLLLTRPYECIYPFFPAAVDSWKSGMNLLETFTRELKDSNSFSDVSLQEKPIFAVSLPRDEWIKLVRTRFWSNLAGFSDEEMENGIDWIQKQCAPEIAFTETQVFIVGSNG